MTYPNNWAPGPDGVWGEQTRAASPPVGWAGPTPADSWPGGPEDGRGFSPGKVVTGSDLVHRAFHDQTVASLKATITELRAQVVAAERERDAIKADRENKAALAKQALSELNRQIDLEAEAGRLSEAVATCSRRCELLMGALEVYQDAAQASLAYLSSVEFPAEGPLERAMVERRRRRTLRQCQAALALPLDDLPTGVPADESEAALWACPQLACWCTAYRCRRGRSSRTAKMT